MDPQELARKIGAGLLSFPVTHFTTEGSLNEASYRSHLSWLLESNPAGLFAAGGTGEYFSMTLEEFSSVVRAAVDETAGRVPVLAGCGYGTAMARQFAAAAETVGADGLLLFPPYLLNADPEGLIAHVKSICDSTSLGVIFYNRDNAVVNAHSGDLRTSLPGDGRDYLLLRDLQLSSEICDRFLRGRTASRS